jgi:hypothetical protein
VGRFDVTGECVVGVLGQKVEKLRAMHLLPRNVTVTKRMLLDLGETLHRRLASRRAGYLFGAMLLRGAEARPGNFSGSYLASGSILRIKSKSRR